MEDHNLYLFSSFCKEELFCNESTFILREDIVGLFHVLLCTTQTIFARPTQDRHSF